MSFPLNLLPTQTNLLSFLHLGILRLAGLLIGNTAPPSVNLASGLNKLKLRLLNIAVFAKEHVGSSLLPYPTCQSTILNGFGTLFFKKNMFHALFLHPLQHPTLKVFTGILRLLSLHALHLIHGSLFHSLRMRLSGSCATSLIAVHRMGYALYLRPLLSFWAKKVQRLLPHFLTCLLLRTSPLRSGKIYSLPLFLKGKGLAMHVNLTEGWLLWASWLSFLWG